VIRQADVVLARRQVGALARLVGRTDDGEAYAPTWFTTGSVVAERTGHRGALGVCDGLDLLVAHMQGKSWGIRRMAVFAPNQVGKSYHCEVVFPAAVFGRLDRARVVATGFGNDYLDRTAPGVKWLTSTPEYRAAYPDVRLGGVAVVDAKDNAHRVDVLRRVSLPGGAEGWDKTGGYLVCRSFGGAVNGIPMDLGIMGDFYKNWADALSPGGNRDRRDFYGGVFSRRQQSRRTAMLLAFTPYTSTDLAHHVLDTWEKEGEPYLVLRFPTWGREDRRAELERWARSPAMREGLRVFLAACAPGGPGPAAPPAGSPGAEPRGCSPELRPYDPRPAGAPLLPFKDRDAEFYEQRRRGATPRDLAALDELDPDSAAAETFGRDLWRWFDPRERPTHRKYAVACDPNKRETTDGAFASLGGWGLDPAPRVAGADGKPADPAHPWHMHRLREARGRWPYSRLRQEILDMLDLFGEARDLVLEHSANGEALAGDDGFLRELERRRVTLWLAEAGGGFSRVKRAGRGWTREKTGDAAALAGGKEERWQRAFVPLREGHFLLPKMDHGRVTCGWVGDQPDGADEAERQGWVTEWARAHPDGVVDRVDEGAMLCAWARSATTLSGWDRYRKA
jgi:hypothetical protein